MIYRFRVLLVLIFIISCSFIVNEGSDKNRLANFIDELNKKEEITSTPLIIIDGFKYNLDINHLDSMLCFSGIDSIIYLQKNSDVAISVYGDAAKGGVVLVTTSLIKNYQNLSIKIKQQAEKMANSTINDNYDILIKFTYPKLVDLMGGSEKMKDIIAKATEGLKAKGMIIDNYKIGDVGKIFVAGKELHCIISDEISMKTNDGHLLINSNLLAVSMDKGENWYFMDCNMGKERLLQLLPAFNDNLIIPAKQNPVKIDN